MNRKRSLLAISAIFVVIGICGYPSTYRVGINGKLVIKRIPLYAKACGFLYRDWMYKDIVRDIVGSEKDGAKKALAILRWTNENISPRIPAGLKIVDDHPLNVIIRQYGAKDQIDDIFTILCAYAGMRSGRRVCYSSDGRRSIWLSFVRADGRWLIFNPARNKYFFNRKGGLGSVDDYLKGDLILSDEDASVYGEFLNNLKETDLSSFTRADEQMPLKRIPAKIKKYFKGRS